MWAIDYEKTIDKGKIVYVSNYYNHTEPILFVSFYTLVFGIVDYLMVSSLIPWENTAWNRYFVLGLILTNVYFVYLFYKKITQRDVLEIQTGLSKEDNRKFCEEFITQNWKWFFCDGNHITGESPLVMVFERPARVNIVFCNGYIMLNVLGAEFKGFRGPWLLGVKSLRRDIIQASEKYKAAM